LDWPECVLTTLKELAKKNCRFIGDPDNLVRRLTIKFEIKLGLWPTVAPNGKRFELASSQTLLRKRGAPDSDAYARSLTRNPGLLGDRFSRGDDAASVVSLK